LPGCNLINPSEPVPGYLQIDKISLDNEDGSGISDAWVYVDNNLIGVFELPAKIPVIASGESDVIIRPGIKVNGIKSTRSYYPFYRPYEVQVDFEPSKVIPLNASSGYESWADIPWKEDFESGGSSFELNENSDTTLIVSNEAKYSGHYGGAVYMDTANSYFEMITSDLFARPDFSNPVGMYLEMNFKCDNYFVVGLYVYNTSEIVQNAIIYLNPTDEWKKIYIDLYNPLLEYTKGTPFKVFVASNLESGKEKGSFYIDDLRIVQQ